MKILKLFIFILLISKNVYALSIGTNEQQVILECEGTADKTTLINTWYVNEPYQYLIAASNGHTTVPGMDIELINTIAAKIGINIEYNQDSWYQDQLDIQSSNADMTAGATYTTERSCNGYYSQN
ncbi:transporter substrate-binding domain-containing protein [Rickettsia sp. 2024-CO-Wats]|uniref:transporter substrate-binding domain-containing protein n=1 Tax=unclassified Rickettsia TaxID=114295 RepID=UPI00370DB7F1